MPALTIAPAASTVAPAKGGAPTVRERKPATTPLPAELAAVRRSRAPLFIVGVVLLLVIAALAMRGRPAVAPPATAAPAPVVTPPPAEAPVRLSLQTEPPQAEVHEGDVLLGTTPLALTRPPGSVSELRDYTSVSRKVRFEADSSISVALERSRPVKKAPGRRAPADDALKDAPF